MYSNLSKCLWFRFNALFYLFLPFWYQNKVRLESSFAEAKITLVLTWPAKEQKHYISYGSSLLDIIRLGASYKNVYFPECQGWSPEWQNLVVVLSVFDIQQWQRLFFHQKQTGHRVHLEVVKTTRTNQGVVNHTTRTNTPGLSQVKLNKVKLMHS